MKTLVVLLISALLVADEFLRLSSPAPDEVKKPAGVPAAANPPKARTRPAPLFTTARKERDFLTLFPKTTSSSVNALRDTVQFYDEDDMPTLYQVWDRGPRSGFLFVRGGQRTANLEFPWA